MLSIYEQLDRDRKRAQHEQRELNGVLAEFAGLRSSLALLKLELVLSRKYDPNQPRVPAGNPDGGQWRARAGPRRRVGRRKARPIALSWRKRVMGHW
jgi:hypothetical protein